MNNSFKKLITVTLKNNSPSEQKTEDLPKQVLQDLDLGKWIFKKEVLIENGGLATRPHSYPIVTLNTKPEYKISVLAQFLHEQIHWVEDGKEGGMISAIKELKRLYPNAPIGRLEGADNEKSSPYSLQVRISSPIGIIRQGKS